MKRQKANKINEIKHLGQTHNPRVITQEYCRVRTPKVDFSKWSQLKEFPIPSFGQ